MRLKTYRSDSVEAALRLARIELGEDAVFLGSRKPDDDGGPGLYEVSFAIVDASEAEPAPPATAAAKAAASSGIAESAPAKPPSRETSTSTAMPLVDGILARDSRSLELPARVEPQRQHWRAFLDPAGEAALQSAAPSPSPDAAPPAPEPESGPPPELFPRVDPAPPEFTPEPLLPPLPNAKLRPEVVEISESPLPSPPATGVAGESASPELADGQFGSRLGEIHEELRQLRELVESLTRAPAGASRPGKGLAGLLAKQGVDPEITIRLTPPQNGVADEDSEVTASYLRARLGELCSMASGLGRGTEGSQIVVLIGPAGAGKTTALAKLAVNFGVGKRRSIHLVSLDPLRVGAVEELRAYGAILGSGITTVDAPEALPAVLNRLAESEDRPDLILVDTAGYPDTTEPRAKRLAAALRSLAATADIHLALDTAMRASDLRRTLDDYLVFGPHKLLFTKIDRTRTFGAIVNETVRTGLPLSYFSGGPHVTANLEPASEAQLSNLLRHGVHERE